VGLLAAADGRRRTDPIEDLAGLRLGVRVDQPGQLLRDYHTALVRTGRNSYTTQLSDRFYLSDAVFLAAVEGPTPLLEGLADALRRPKYLLSLGRRSCVPSRPVLLGLTPMSVDDALAEQPWLASERVARRNDATVIVETVADCLPGTDGAEVRSDAPVSFDPVRRRHGSRSVLRGAVRLANPLGTSHHDPLAALDDAS